MRLQNRDAFTLLETVFALAIAATVLTPLFMVQGNILLRTATSFAHWERIITASNYLRSMEQDPTLKSQAEKEETITREQKNEDPAVLLRYTQAPVDKKSALADVAYLDTKRVTFSWEWNGRGYHDSIVTFASTLSDEYYYE